MADSLVIRVSGDITDYEKALEQAESETQSLSDNLSGAAKTAGVAFAALTAEAFLAVKAFSDKEKITNQLTQALQTQGVYSKELLGDYQRQADAIELLTGLDADAINVGQARLQSMIGQTRITDELSGAIADLAVGKLGGDLVGAYDLVGKAADGNTSILKRYGIEVVDTGDRAKNLAAITDALANKFGGQAEAAAAGTGSFVQLGRAFGDLQEEIGARLAPAAVAVTKVLTSMIDTIKDNKALVDFGVAIGVAAAAVAGITLAVTAGGTAFLAFSAALKAAGVATSAMTLAARGLAAATGLGLIITVVTLIALNWDAVWPRMQGVFAAFTTSITEMAGGLGKILLGALSFDPAKIKEGLDQTIAAVQKGMQTYNTVVDAGLKEREAKEAAAEQTKVDRNNANAANEEAKERAKAALLLQITNEKRQLILDQLNRESEDKIKLQQEEISLLEQMADEHNAKIVGQLSARLQTVRDLQAIQAQEDVEARRTLNDTILSQNAEFEALSDEQKAVFLEKNRGALSAQLLTENEARQKAAQDSASQQIKSHNDFLLNQQKFGTAYALINKVMYSDVVQGAAKGLGELTQLQQSNNATLKSIGKAAAVADITIKTAQSAMNIYNGFSTIPIVGPALGIAGAAAAIAFGAEKIGQVTAAADGGEITGGIPGMDSVRALLMPGELVVPTRNFDEVVNAVAASRGGGTVGGGESMALTIVLELKDSLAEFIEQQSIQRDNLNISIRGA